jgi:anti-sigma-K factor RskA
MTMTCEDRLDLIPFYALGTLPVAEQDELRAHLEGGCPVCEAALAETRVLAAHLAMSLEPIAPPARVRERLIERVKADRGGSDRASAAPLRMNNDGVVPTPLRRSSVADWTRSLVAAGIAAAIAYVAASISFDHRAGRIEQQVVQVESHLNEMELTKKRTEQNILLPRSPAIQLVQMKGTPDAPGAIGEINWDKARGVWYFYATGLPAAASGKTYELWFVAGDKKVRAGVFDVTQSGEGSLVAAIPAELGKITLAAVTDEPAGGSVQPTGKFWLTAAITQ